MTHTWINGFKCLWRLFQNLNAIDAFENREITMRGQYKGQEINDAIEIERQKLINEAKKEPICMLVDSPDPHGKLICLHFSAVCLHFFILN